MTPEINWAAASNFLVALVAKMKVKARIFSQCGLLILYKQQKTSKGTRIRGGSVKIDWDGFRTYWRLDVISPHTFSEKDSIDMKKKPSSTSGFEGGNVR